MLILLLVLVNLFVWPQMLGEALSTLSTESPAPFFALPMGVEDDWQPGQAQWHRKPITITDYDPTSCLSAWASYVTDDFKDISKWHKNWLDIASWKIARADDWNERIAPFMTTKQFPSYTTTTYWSPAPTPKQCDGAQRVVWASESTSTQILAQSFVIGDNATGLPAEIIDPFLNQPQRFPVCQIHPEDCDVQWSLFQDIFSNWTAKLGEVNPFLEVTNPTCIYDSSMCYPESLLEKQLDIYSWMKLRGYQSARGFLSNCPQFEPICKKGTDIYKGVVDLSNSWRGCDVKAGRFALLYFRAPNNATRDICANDGWGANVKPPYENLTDSIIKTAVVEHVIFQRYGTESESTLHTKMTMTSPSVYLAYDKIHASGNCQNPGQILTDGIITLHPSELYSVVELPSSDCSETTDFLRENQYEFTHCKQGSITTRSFNLADIQGPVPSKAYFKGGVVHDTITENRYFPMILMPSQILEHEPALVSCWPFASFDGKPFSKIDIMQVWDPPIGYDPTPFVKPATITVTPRTRSASSDLPTPGIVFTSYNTPVMTEVSPDRRPGNLNPPWTQGAHNIPESYFQLPQGLDSVAVITIEDSKVTAFIFDQGSRALVGSQTMTLGGPPLVTAGATLSLGEDGRLDLGSGNFIHLATKPNQFRSSDLDRIPKDYGNAATERSDRVGGGQLSSSEGHLAGGGSGIDPQTDGHRGEFGIENIGPAGRLSESMRPRTRTIDEDGTFITTKGGSGRKKSAAGSNVGSFRKAFLVFCGMIEIWWGMYAF